MVGLAAKREAAEILQRDHRMSERRACKVIELARSTKRHEPKPNEENEVILKRLHALAEKKKRFGAPRLHQLLLREGFKINHKRTERLYRLAGLSLRCSKKKRKRLRSEARAPLADAGRPNQHWAMDFVSDQLTGGGRFRSLTVVDIFTRESLEIEVARSLPSARVVEVLNRLKFLRGKPETIIVDNGPEMISLALDQWAYENGVNLQFIQPGKPVQNAFIESFNGTFRDECLNTHWFYDLDDARSKIKQWQREYNEENPHRSLGYLTPEEFANQWKLKQTG